MAVRSGPRVYPDRSTLKFPEIAWGAPGSEHGRAKAEPANKHTIANDCLRRFDIYWFLSPVNYLAPGAGFEPASAQGTLRSRKASTEWFRTCPNFRRPSPANPASRWCERRRAACGKHLIWI